jgi:hypothetical protein
MDQFNPRFITFTLTASDILGTCRVHVISQSLSGLVLAMIHGDRIKALISQKLVQIPHLKNAISVRSSVRLFERKVAKDAKTPVPKNQTNETKCCADAAPDRSSLQCGGLQ